MVLFLVPRSGFVFLLTVIIFSGFLSSGAYAREASYALKQVWLPEMCYDLSWASLEQKKSIPEDSFVYLRMADACMVMSTSGAGNSLSFYGLVSVESTVSSQGYCDFDIIALLPAKYHDANCSYDDLVAKVATEYDAHVFTPDLFKMGVFSYKELENVPPYLGLNGVAFHCFAGRNLRGFYSDRQYLYAVTTYWRSDGTSIARPDRVFNLCDKNRPIYLRKMGDFIDLSTYKMQFRNKGPINVAFDIDGTLLFTEIASSYAFRHISVRSGESVEDRYKRLNSIFYDVVAEMSQKKYLVSLLVDFHEKRGDKIYVITARGATSNDTKLSDYISKTFDLYDDIVFVGSVDKVSDIKKLGVAFYYGDSDTDVMSAMLAGAVPVRILRSTQMDAASSYKPGTLGETVLMMSYL